MVKNAAKLRETLQKVRMSVEEESKADADPTNAMFYAIVLSRFDYYLGLSDRKLAQHPDIDCNGMFPY